VDKIFLNINFYLKDDLGVDFIACYGKLTREGSADVNNKLTHIVASPVGNSNKPNKLGHAKNI